MGTLARRYHRIALVLSASLLLTGCSTGDDDAPAATSPSQSATTIPAVAVTATLPATEAAAATPAAATTEPPATPSATAETVATAEPTPTADPSTATYQEYSVPAGTHPHDVAPAPDGSVWYTAQHVGALGLLDPATSATRHIPLGAGSAPHGVIVGPDGAPWITDSGLNAIVRVDPETEEVTVYPLPDAFPNANLNTAVFAGNILWFTGQNGVYGRLDPASGELQAFEAPRGRGPYGITVTPDGAVYYASLAGNHIARIDPATGAATPIDPPTPGQGARRVWSDSQGRVWVSEWISGQVSVYDPATDAWQMWRLPGESPRAYAVYVDERDIVWLTDFPNNAIVRFEPVSATFLSFPLPSADAAVRQLLGRPGEVWGAESATDKIVVLRVP